MPSEKVLESKKQIVADLTETLKSSAAGVLVDYKGINVADDTKLRKELQRGWRRVQRCEKHDAPLCCKRSRIRRLG